MWGLDQFANNRNQLKINFSTSVINNDWLRKNKSLNAKDKELLSDLSTIFDLGTQAIIGRDEGIILDDFWDLMSEVNLKKT